VWVLYVDVGVGVGVAVARLHLLQTLTVKVVPDSRVHRHGDKVATSVKVSPTVHCAPASPGSPLLSESRI